MTTTTIINFYNIVSIKSLREDAAFFGINFKGLTRPQLTKLVVPAAINYTRQQGELIEESLLLKAHKATKSHNPKHHLAVLAS